MTNNEASNLTDLADGTLSDGEWQAWLAAHPDEAAEVLIARRVRQFASELRLAAIEVPAGFEDRLIARIRQDITLLDLLDLGLAGMGQAVIELLSVLFGLFSPPLQPAAG